MQKQDVDIIIDALAAANRILLGYKATCIAQGVVPITEHEALSKIWSAALIMVKQNDTAQ